MNQAQKRHYYLTFFTAHHIWAFYDYFTSEKLRRENEEMCKTLIRFVNGDAQLPPHGNTGMLCEIKDGLEILCMIGYELDNIFRNIPKQTRKIETIQQRTFSKIVMNDKLFVEIG